MAIHDNVSTIDKSEISNKEDIREPSRYKVVMLNDDITTMSFVEELLQRIFNKPAEEANAIMMRVHENGRGICGVYTKEIAEAKIARVHMEARQAGYPLKCIMEED